MSSELSEIEVARALARQLGDRRRGLRIAERTLSGVNLVDLDARIAHQACTIGPFELSTVDAVHLATALGLGDRIAAFVAYDRRLCAAARGAGLPVVSPT